MSTLKSDPQGFLIDGMPLFKRGEGESILSRINRNVEAIRGLLAENKGGKGSGSAAPTGKAATPVAAPAARAGQAMPRELSRVLRTADTIAGIGLRAQAGTAPMRSSGEPATPRRSGSAAGQPIIVQAGDTVSNVDARSTFTKINNRVTQLFERQRDDKGRFVAPAAPKREGKGGIASKAQQMAAMLRTPVAATGNVSAAVDPSIAVSRELSEIAGGALTGMRAAVRIALPAGRASGPLEASPEAWYRRIFGELRALRREESVFNRAQLRTLKEIEGKPLPVARGGEGGGGSLLGKLPFAGLAGAAGGALASAGKAMLRRLPIIGGALALLGGAADANAAENDATLTREQKDRRIGGAAGSTAGGLAGMFGGMKAGAMLGAFAGPIGAALGTVVGGAAGMFFGDKAGEVIGERMGGFVNDLRQADIAGAVTRLVDSTMGYLKSGWDKVSGMFSGIISQSVAALEKLGVNVEGMKKAVGQTVDAAKEKVGQVATAVKDKAVEVGGAAKRGFNEAMGGKAEEPANTAGVRGQGDVRAWEAGQRQADAGWLTGAARAGGRVVGQVRAGYEVGTGQMAPGQAQQAGGIVEQAAQSLGKGAGKGITAAANRWQAAKGHIVGAANAAGVDAGVLAKIAHFESGFDEDAMPIQKKKDGTRIRLSSAHGYGQFLDGTWRDALNRHGAKYGVEGAGNLTVEQASKHRGNRQLQAQMLAEFTKENIEKGRRFGGKDDDANVYAFHNLGDGDARRLLTGMQSGMTARDALSQGIATAKNPEKERRRVEAVIKGNPSLYKDGSITAAEAYANMGKAMRGGDAYAADARQMQQTSGVSAPPAVPRAAVPPAMPTASVSASVPRVDSATIAPPIAPAVKDAVPTQIPVSQPDRRQSMVFINDQRLTARDLSDRRLAHIVTGGIAGL